MECYHCGTPIKKLTDRADELGCFEAYGFAACQLGRCESCHRHFPVGCQCGEPFDSLLTLHQGWSNSTPTGVDYQVVQCKKCEAIYLRRFWQSRIDWTGDDDEYDESIKDISLEKLAGLLQQLEGERDAGGQYRPFPGALDVAQRLGNQKLIHLLREGGL